MSRDPLDELKTPFADDRYESEDALQSDRLTLIGSGVFNATFYREAAGPDAADDPERHYLMTGWRLGLEPNPGFDGAFLLPYYVSAGFDGPPAITFARLREARWPTYASRADAEPTADLVRESGLFDIDEYRDKLAVHGFHVDPALHYVLVGERLGWCPSKRFDPAYYLEGRPDVAKSAISCLGHYLQYGRKEGLRPTPPTAEYATHSGNFAAGKPTIILVSHDASRSGAPIIALNLARHLRETYNILTLLLDDGDLTESFEEVSAQVICIVEKNRNPTDLGHLVRDISRWHTIRYAIVNSIASSDILPELASEFIPTVTLIHEFASYLADVRGRRDALGWTMEPVFSTTLTVESFCRQQPGLSQRRIHVHPQGRCQLPVATDASTRSRERKRIEEALRPHGSEKDVVVLGAGAIELRKGTDIFLAAAAAALRLAPDCSLRFVWIGRVPKTSRAYFNLLIEQVARSGLTENVVMLDEVTDMEPVYAMADIFFLSSRLDPLPNVTIDVASLGIPIICFEGATGMVDSLKQDPAAAAAVVPYLDTGAVAQKLVELAKDEDLRRHIGEATRRVTQAAFDMKRYVAQLDEIGALASDTMEQWRADLDTIIHDPTFDMSFFLAPDAPEGSRRKAVLRFLAEWSVVRAVPHPTDFGLRRPVPGFQPQVFAQHHPELFDANANPLAEFIRKGKPSGPWVHTVVRPDDEGLKPDGLKDLRVALQAHFFYPELINDLLSKLAVNGARYDLLLSTDHAEKAETLRAATSHFDRGRVQIRVTPNRGRNIGALLTGYGDVLQTDYDVVGHVHGKRSLHAGETLGDNWREFLWQHLIGDRNRMMDCALTQFANDERLGLLFAEDPHNCEWDLNLGAAEELAARIKLATPLPTFFQFPLGTMFWARTKALAPLLDLKFDWSDYPEEPVPIDGTVLHALERFVPFATEKAGFTFATFHIPDLTW